MQRRVLAGAAIALLCGGETCDAPIRFTAIALVGTPAPGTDATFSWLDWSPVVGLGGQFAFRIRLSGPGVTPDVNDQSIWAGRPRAPGLVARTDDPAPGTGPDVRFASLEMPPISDTGAVSFRATLRGPGVTAANDVGIWSNRSGMLELRAREGDAAPGMDPGIRFVELGTAVADAQGGVLFDAVISGPGVTAGTDRTIWLDETGSPSLVARAGEEAPIGGGEARFQAFDEFRHRDGAGALTFAAFVEGPEITLETTQGIWSTRGDMLDLVVRAGEPAPGAEPAIFRSFQMVAANRKGELAFSAYLVRPDGSHDGLGIWTERDGVLELVAREGQAAPGVGPGVRLETMHCFRPLPLSIDDAGHLIFSASLAGPGVSPGTTSALFATTDAGELRLVLRGGDPASGLPEGIVVDAVSYGLIREDGGAIALASLRGDGVTTENDYALLWVEASGRRRLLLREGDPLQVLPGDHRIVRNFGLYFPFAIFPGLHSLAGERLAVVVYFRDGSGGIVRIELPFRPPEG